MVEPRSVLGPLAVPAAGAGRLQPMAVQPMEPAHVDGTSTAWQLPQLDEHEEHLRKLEDSRGLQALREALVRKHGLHDREQQGFVVKTKLKISGAFNKRLHEDETHGAENEENLGWRIRILEILENQRTELAVLFFVIADIVLVGIEAVIDVTFDNAHLHEAGGHRLLGGSGAPRSCDTELAQDIAGVVRSMSLVVLFAFCTEILLKFSLAPCLFVRHPGHVIDAVVIVLSIIFEFVLHHSVGVLFMFFRLWRLVRICHGLYEEVRYLVGSMETEELLRDSWNELSTYRRFFADKNIHEDFQAWRNSHGCAEEPGCVSPKVKEDMRKVKEHLKELQELKGMYGKKVEAPAKMGKCAATLHKKLEIEKTSRCYGLRTTLLEFMEDVRFELFMLIFVVADFFCVLVECIIDVLFEFGHDDHHRRLLPIQLYTSQSHFLSGTWRKLSEFSVCQIDRAEDIAHTCRTISIALLWVFAAELFLKFMLHPAGFISHIGHHVDTVVVVCSIVFEFALHNSAGALLIVFRFWRVVRIAHTWYEESILIYKTFQSAGMLEELHRELLFYKHYVDEKGLHQQYSEWTHKNGLANEDEKAHGGNELKQQTPVAETRHTPQGDGTADSILSVATAAPPETALPGTAC